VTDFRDAVVDMDQFYMHGLDVSSTVGPDYTGVGLLCKQISPEK
jgi:hypothetical protein